MVQKHIKKALKQALPPSTRMGRFVRRAYKSAKTSLRSTPFVSSNEYQQWIKKEEIRTLAPLVKNGYNPLISIVVPAYNTPDRYLVPLIDSVLAQTYGNWELCLVNASPDSERRAAIEKEAARDGRIRSIEQKENLGIAGNTNVGLQQARGEFIAFLDHDDTLAPFALNEVVAALQEDQTLDVFYSDEDKLSEDGTWRMDPFFKPGWSPELFHTVNYLAHFVVVRAKVVQEVDGIRSGYDGAQDFDFLLRVFDVTQRIHHIPHVSYHWRLAAGSTAKDTGEKNYADSAGQRALQDYLKRNKIKAGVLPFEGQNTVHRFKYELPSSIPLYIATPNGRALWMSRIAADLPPYTEVRLADISQVPKSAVVVVVAEGAAPQTAADLVELAGMAIQPGVGLVGGVAQVDKKIVPMGFAVQQGGLVPFLQGYDADEWTHTGQPCWPRNLVGVEPGCFAVAAKNLGADPGILNNPFELSVVLFNQGLRNVFWPFSKFLSLRKLETPVIKSRLVSQDPYLNPNLIIKNGRLRLARRLHL